MLGWALGGGSSGGSVTRLGRARALSLTVLTYAAFTGLSFFAQTWWHLLIFRFLAALGIGGEWAVGASLLSETWPRRWRPWIAAVLQTGVNVGILGAGLANIILAAAPPRYLFLSGCCRRCWCFWIRGRCRNGGMAFRQSAGAPSRAGVRDLFRGEVRSITIWVVLVCGVSLDRPLGLHVLASATPAEPAGSVELVGGAEEQACQRRDVHCDRLVHLGELLRRLAGAA